ncbi:MAG: winged helix-turn-helix domain-containing protein [Dehalococcoidia bacterium]
MQDTPRSLPEGRAPTAPAVVSATRTNGRPAVETPARTAFVVGVENRLAALTHGLSRLGLVVQRVEPADTGIAARLATVRPDFAVIDADGLGREHSGAALTAAVETLRAHAVPVLVAVAAPTLPMTDTMLLADDILLPPHDPAEAALRAALALRRKGSTPRLASVGALTVDLEGFRAWLTGQPLTLTYTEFQLLRLLLLNRGKVLTRQALLNRIWGYDYLGGLRTVDVHIRRLRAKLEHETPTLIETVRHVGYRIAE